MESKIVLNEYIKADIAFDILSQSIEKTRKNIKESEELLEKLLECERQIRKGNTKLINKIIEGEI